MNFEGAITTRIQQTNQLSWGEFYPENGLLKKAGVSTAHDFAENMGIDFLSLPPGKAGGGDLFGRMVARSNALKKPSFPVNSMEELEQYALPNLDVVTLDKLGSREENKDNLLLLEGPIQLLSSIMPFDLFMMSLARDKNLMEKAVKSYFDWLLLIVKKAIDKGISGVVLGDDIAGTSGLMMSPRILEAMYFPFLQDFIGRCELPVIVHSDGDVRMVIPSYIEAGAAGLQSIEREAGMHIEELVKTYPNFLFWGGISREAFTGDLALLREEASLLRKLRHQGAFVVAGSCTGILDEMMEIENLRALRAMIND
ncbi:hypothetical protein JR334_06695 [Clostridia bacterium]|nr:hypothetical protein JR334_06695 [Clostridia bacterium]